VPSEAPSYQQIVTGYRIAFSLHEVYSNQGLVREFMCQVDIYEEAIREERTRIARELDSLVQTFLSASMQLGVAANSLPSDLPVKPRLDRILQVMDEGIREGLNAMHGLLS
jgi:signal transduction histidine kinase